MKRRHNNSRRPSRGRALAPEERTLWRSVTKDVVPLSREVVMPSRDDLYADEKSHDNQGEKVGVQGRALPALSDNPAPDVRKQAGPTHAPDAFISGDPRLDRRVARGRTPIEATLDLHGHTQVTARRVFETFLATARMRGNRCVLVITGKGDPSSGKGILRKRVQEWVNEPGLRADIVRVSQAHPRHGGAGAFYLFLKKPEAKG